MKYISIDGDDIGNKIASCYLSNDCDRLRLFSEALQSATSAISDFLTKEGFTILFCAADGVVASTECFVDFNFIFEDIGRMAPSGITFSAGVGESLRETYVALLSAKSNGKQRLHYYSSL